MDELIFFERKNGIIQKARIIKIDQDKVLVTWNENGVARGKFIPISKILPSSSNIKIEHVSYSSICDSDDKCLRIKEFEIPNNFSNNCFEKNLPIIFGSIGKSTSGFYPPNGEFIESSQENYSFCKIIKKFRVNSKYVLLIIGESIALTPNIEFGWIDEKNEKIFYLKIFKVIIDSNFYEFF
ncbi:unnamed protein product [Brachionus calyciflorus]|uniref:Uncharacterized protein n=1 Tax=Brachionus calyciflorus TaxID=104777 RepID=A0A814CBK6_9BILA|nr:unnamed protein product [Brachionus calyciflorus]